MARKQPALNMTAIRLLATDDLQLALRQARAAGIERIDAECVLAFCLELGRAQVIAFSERKLGADAIRVQAMLMRLSNGEPLAYVLGRREFFGLPLQVGPAVLIPRPETEHLVEWALEFDGQGLRVADLGTGSGAIALALAERRPNWHIHAVDLSVSALQIAQHNAKSLGLSVHWHQGSWFSPLAGLRFDLVLSNPPYLAEGDPHCHDLRHEPSMALVAGPSGLEHLHAIALDAPKFLTPDGWLAMEHGYNQGQDARTLLAQLGYTQVSTRRDYAGHERFTFGQCPQ